VKDENIKLAKLLIESVEELIVSKISNLRFNKKKKAVIHSLNLDGTANINLDNELYEDVNIRTGLAPQINEVVFVEIPNNQMKNMYVDTAKGSPNMKKVYHVGETEPEDTKLFWIDNK